MSWQSISYTYPTQHDFEKMLLWVDSTCRLYFSMKEKDTDDWTFFSGEADHTLASGSALVDKGTSESNAQTNYWSASPDANDKIIAILPAITIAKYVRVHVDDANDNPTQIYEFRPSTRLIADEIVAGQLHITDAFASAPIITVTKSSVDRIQIGNFSGSTYGLIGYDGSSNMIFELSDNQTKIAGWTINQTQLTAGSITIDSATPYIAWGSATDYLTGIGIWMGNDSGTYKWHCGDPDNDHIKWDGSDLTVTGVIHGTTDMASTTSDTFEINNDNTDTNVQLIFGRTTGGDATLQWNGTTVSLDKSFTPSGNIIMPDGGTIGQAAGPLLTFDDTNNYLEITGCKVGIGNTSPAYALDIESPTGGFTLRLNQSDADHNYVVIDRYSSDYDGLIGFQTGGSDEFYIGMDGGNADKFTITPDSLFGTGGMWFDNAGNVGIGTDSPSALIHGIKTTEQLRLGYDASNYVSFTVGSGGNLTIAPTGDLLFNPTGNDVYPTNNYDINLGLITKKFLTLHAAELWVETLVAHDTMATIGGRIIVSPTTTLDTDLGDGVGDTTISVEHNHFANGDFVRMEADGKVEFMQIASAAGGAGPYTYTVTRDEDGSGRNLWYAGDAVVKIGTTGDGFIDLYSLAGVKAGSEVGPTIVGNVMTSAAYNGWVEAWAIGNLNGIYGYSADTYGAAMGEYGTDAVITIEGTNGIRFLDSSDVVRAQLTGTTLTLGYTTNEHVAISNTAVQIKDGATVYTEISGGNVTVGDTSNEHVNITTSGVQCKDGASIYATFASTTTVGVTTTEHINITSSSVQIKDSSSVYTDLTAGVLTLGLTSGGEYVLIDSTGIEIYGNAVKNFEVTSAGLAYVGDQSNEHIKLSSSGTQIYDGATLLATYGSSTTLYDTGGADRLVLGTSGVFIGDQTEGEYVNIDSTNGIRMYGGGVQHVSIANTGSFWFGATSSTERIEWDSTNGVRIYDGSNNAVLQFKPAGEVYLLSGRDFNVEAGGDIVMTPDDSSPSLIKWTTVHNLGAASTAAKGLCFWPTTENDGYFKIGYDPINNVDWRYYHCIIQGQIHSTINSRYNATTYSSVSATSDGAGATNRVRLLNSNGGTTVEVDLSAYDTALYPATTGKIDIGYSGKSFKCGWFSDYLIAEGGIYVGGTSDPGTGNLLVSGYSMINDYLVALGGIHVGGIADPGTDNIIIDGTSSFTGNAFPTNDSSVTLGTSSLCWSNIYGDAGVTACSDEKWKTILGQEPLGLDFINRLPVIEYYLNKNGKQREGIYHGITGQDLEQALIECNYDPHKFAGLEYNKDESGQLWMGIIYEQLTAPIIRSIQEIDVKVNSTELEIINLKNRVSRLEQEIDLLRSQ